MCIALDTILADQQTHDARNTFACVFDQLLSARTLVSNQSGIPCQHSVQLADNLSVLAQSYREHLHILPRHDPYSRHIIGTDDDWIGYICRWEQNITSSIHGHPSFAYYQVLSGRIVMDFFEPVCKDKAQLVSTNEMGSGDSIFSSTPKGQFDNLIHRVRTIDSPVFTIHLYSDNPAKGRVFQETRGAVLTTDLLLTK